tara:strand:+ start:141 stop:320 length:180 start_codon:yes stop_codon:yes gene_type:complete
MATTENKYKLLPATTDKLELIKNYAKGKDDWWIEKQIDILEVLIKLEANNAILNQLNKN